MVATPGNAPGESGDKWFTVISASLTAYVAFIVLLFCILWTIIVSLCMTIWTKNLQIFKFIVFRITINMMKLQWNWFTIPIRNSAAFTYIRLITSCNKMSFNSNCLSSYVSFKQLITPDFIICYIYSKPIAVFGFNSPWFICYSIFMWKLFWSSI